MFITDQNCYRHPSLTSMLLTEVLKFSLGSSEDNKVISPLCITGAMYMLAAGAKGQTQQEIIDYFTKTEGQSPEETFQKYNDLRNFHSDSGNAHTLNIGKLRIS